MSKYGGEVLPRLFGFKPCPFVGRVELALAHKKIPFEYQEVPVADISARQSLSPTGKVPVLEHGGNKLWESAVIVQYIDETWPESPLMTPYTPLQRAVQRTQVHFCNTKLSPALHASLFGSRDPSELLNALAQLETSIQAQKSEGPYFLGKNVAFIDIMFAPFLERVQLLATARPDRLKLNDLNSCYPLVMTWLRAMQSTEAYKSIQSRHSIPALLEIYRPYLSGPLHLKLDWHP